mmetsp:Transcript_42291/g.50722  ORF Transcript_42291/g.50722 Transcript_42291/m.50722 type:complete len:272 (+) Transcript_42291:34-849(+)
MKQKKKKRRLHENKDGKKDVVKSSIPAAYRIDLNKLNITGKVPIELSNRISKFNVPMTQKERNRRLERQERFETKETGSSIKNKDNKSDDTSFCKIESALTCRRKLPHVQKRKAVNNISYVKRQYDGFGTCQHLTKFYLRLTTFPKPSEVRPLSVLRLSFDHVTKKYSSEEEAYEWVNEQLKSVRQDLTVQRLFRTDFVVKVYETHARIALENGDLNEFNQCQSMLISLTQPGGVIVSNDGSVSNGCSESAELVTLMGKKRIISLPDFHAT